MARENSFMLMGELAEAPIVFQNDKTQKYRVSISIKTVRRNGRIDYPRVSSYGLTEQQAREFVKDLKVGAFLLCRGMVSTRMVDKPIKCNKCGNGATMNDYYDFIPFDETCIIPVSPTSASEKSCTSSRFLCV